MGTTTAPPVTVDEALTTTRSVRRGLDFSRPVSRELIEECIAIALQAPTGSNLQNAHFLVVTDEEKRNALGDIYRKGWEVYEQTPVYYGKSPRPPEPEKKARWDYIMDEGLYLLEHIQEAPALVIPCVDFGVGRGKAFAEAGYARDAPLPAVFHGAVWGAILPAAWSFRLAARARNLGTCWTVVHCFLEEAAAEVLGIPYDRVIQAAMFPVAHTTPDQFFTAERPPLDEVVHWDAW